jgi:hypothetical protein
MGRGKPHGTILSHYQLSDYSTACLIQMDLKLVNRTNCYEVPPFHIKMITLGTHTHENQVGQGEMN